MQWHHKQYDYFGYIGLFIQIIKKSQFNSQSFFYYEELHVWVFLRILWTLIIIIINI